MATAIAGLVVVALCQSRAQVLNGFKRNRHKFLNLNWFKAEL